MTDLRSFRDSAEASRYGKRGQRGRPAEVWCIEGDYVTLAEMAARLGTDKSTARKRLHAARRLPDLVTWETLRTIAAK